MRPISTYVVYAIGLYSTVTSSPKSADSHPLPPPILMRNDKILRNIQINKEHALHIVDKIYPLERRSSATVCIYLLPEPEKKAASLLKPRSILPQSGVLILPPTIVCQYIPLQTNSHVRCFEMLHKAAQQLLRERRCGIEIFAYDIRRRYPDVDVSSDDNVI